jgi:predicted ATP-grasp superfamily ATP-dependent carboligase
MPRSLPEFSKTVLLGSSVRALAQSCRRLTSPTQPMFIWALDQFADRDCVSAVDKVSQIELSDVAFSLFGDVDSTGIEPRGRDTATNHSASSEQLLFLPGGGTENYASLIHELAANHHWCGITGDSLLSLRDPQILFEIARQSGLKAPLTYSHKTHPNRQSFARVVAEFDKNSVWLWKTANKGGGLGVSKIQSESEFAYFFAENQTDFLQQFIPGAPYGATIIISANGHAEWVGACRLLPASERLQHLDIQIVSNHGSVERVVTSYEPREDFPFLFAGAVGPCRISTCIQEQLLRFAEACFRTFGIRGWFQVDFIVDEAEQSWVLEVNPRWSATMEIYERTYGMSLTAKHLEAWDICVAPTAVRQPEAGLVCWKDVIYADDDFLWTQTHLDRVDTLNTKYRAVYGWDLIADIPNSQQSFAPGMPIFSVLAMGKTSRDLFAARSDAQAVLRS